MDDKDAQPVGEDSDEVAVSPRSSHDSVQGNPASEYQELPSSTSTRSSVPSFASSSQGLNIGQLDETNSPPSAAVSTRAVAVREQAEVEEPHFPNEVPGELSTSSGDTARDGAIGSDTSDLALLKQAHELLLPIFEEIAIYLKDENFYNEYYHDCKGFFSSPSTKKKVYLCRKLRRYLERRRTVFKKRYPSIEDSCDCLMHEGFEILMRIVLLPLMSILLESSVTVDTIVVYHRNLRELYSRFDQFWSVQDYKDHQDMVEKHKIPFEGIFSSTRLALEALLASKGASASNSSSGDAETEASEGSVGANNSDGQI